MPKRLQAVLASPFFPAAILVAFLISLATIAATWYKLCPECRSAPSVAAPAAPQPERQAPPPTVTVNGVTVPLVPGLKIAQHTSESGGVLTEKHERRSLGNGAGLHTNTEGGAVGFSGGSAPNSALGPDDTAGATGGSSGDLKQTFAAGLNLYQLAAIACGGFAVYFVTRKPPNKVASIYCGASGGALWFLGAWALLIAFILGLCVLAWKAHLLGAAQGAIDSLVYAIRGKATEADIHKDAADVSTGAERQMLEASKVREGA